LYYKIVNKRKKIATIIADILGYIILWPLSILKKKELPREDIKEILIIRTAYIGDVVMTLPVLKPLKEKYTKANITFLTSFAAREVLINNPCIDNVLTYDAFWFYPVGFSRAVRDYRKFLSVLRARRYDLIIEARADIRDILLLARLARGTHRISYGVGGGGYLLTRVVPYKELKHKVDYHLDLIKSLGAEVNELEWEIPLSQEEQTVVRTLLSETGIANTDLIIGIHPGGRKELKCWASDNFAKLADSLISLYKVKVVFTGSRPEVALIEDIMERMEHEAINLAGSINIRILSGLISRVNLFICNDSAPLHIASAAKIPTIAIFGPSKSRETGPYGNIHRVVEKEFPCRSSCDEDVCKHEVFKQCMNAIQLEDVLAAVSDIWEEVFRQHKTSAS
jgi:predicted lipopolysaccharide heptosyltransferase III